MTRDEIAKEFDLFFEFDTEDRSTVTSVSARLLAERIADLAVATERDRICELLGALPITNSNLKLIRDVIRNGKE